VKKEYLDNNLPDYIMILAWNFAEELLRKMSIIRIKG